MLYEAVRDKVEIRFGTGVEKIVDAESGVHVVLSDGTAQDADLLIGTDGLHSTVRELVFGPEERFRFDLNHVITAFTLNQVPDGMREGAITTVSTTGRTVAVASVGPGRAAAYFTHSSSDPAAELADGPRPTLARTYGDLGGVVPDLLAQLHRTESVYFDGVSQAIVDRWSSGRVVLLGDAAWCVSPVAGYGASLAVLGADRLGTAIERHPHDLPAALREWEAELRPLVNAKQKRGRRGARLHAPDNLAHLMLRDLFLRAAALPLVTRSLQRRARARTYH